MTNSRFAQVFAKFFIHSLRTRVTLSVLLPLIFILGTFMVIQYEMRRRMMLENLALLASQTAVTIENSLQEAMLNHDQEQLQSILNAIGQNKMLRSVYLMDITGKVIFAPENHQVGVVLSNRSPSCLPCHSMPAAQRPGSIVVTDTQGQQVFRSMNPIQNRAACQGCHEPSQRLIGILMTDISMTLLEKSLNNDLALQVIWWSAAVFASALIVNIVVDRFVLKRLETLSMAIKELGLGQVSSPLLEKSASRINRDEIDQVHFAFNEMAQKIFARETENQQLTGDINRQSRERGELLKRLITAQEDERKRIARELHDQFGQALAVLALQTQVAQKFVSTRPEQASQVLNQTQELIGETSEQMYDMIMALRPSVLDDLGLLAALRSHAERIFRGTDIVFSLDGSRMGGRLPPSIEIVLYRVFQEALTNIIRYARARNVSIVLARENGVFSGEISDDGQGFDLAALRKGPDEPQGMGLLGMQERVAQQNGMLDIISEPGCGTRIVIHIPLEEESVG